MKTLEIEESIARKEFEKTGLDEKYFNAYLLGKMKAFYFTMYTNMQIRGLVCKRCGEVARFAHFDETLELCDKCNRIDQVDAYKRHTEKRIKNLMESVINI